MNILEERVQDKISWCLNDPLYYGSAKCANDIINLCIEEVLTIGTNLNNRCIDITKEYNAGKFNGIAEYKREIAALKL